MASMFSTRINPIRFAGRGGSFHEVFKYAVLSRLIERRHAEIASPMTYLSLKAGPVRYPIDNSPSRHVGVDPVYLYGKSKAHVSRVVNETVKHPFIPLMHAIRTVNTGDSKVQMSDSAPRLKDQFKYFTGQWPFFRQFMRPHDRAILFEPDEEYRRGLEQSISSQERRRVTVVPFDISEQNDDLKPLEAFGRPTTAHGVSLTDFTMNTNWDDVEAKLRHFGTHYAPQMVRQAPNLMHIVSYPIFAENFQDDFIRDFVKTGVRNILHVQFQYQSASIYPISNELRWVDPWGIGLLIANPPENADQDMQDLSALYREILQESPYTNAEYYDSEIAKKYFQSQVKKIENAAFRGISPNYLSRALGVKTGLDKVEVSVSHPMFPRLGEFETVESLKYKGYEDKEIEAIVCGEELSKQMQSSLRELMKSHLESKGEDTQSIDDAIAKYETELAQQKKEEAEEEALEREEEEEEEEEEEMPTMRADEDDDELKELERLQAESQQAKEAADGRAEENQSAEEEEFEVEEDPEEVMEEKQEEELKERQLAELRALPPRVRDAVYKAVQARVEFWAHADAVEAEQMASMGLDLDIVEEADDDADGEAVNEDVEEMEDDTPLGEDESPMEGRQLDLDEGTEYEYTWDPADYSEFNMNLIATQLHYLDSHSHLTRDPVELFGRNFVHYAIESLPGDWVHAKESEGYTVDADNAHEVAAYCVYLRKKFKEISEIIRNRKAVIEGQDHNSELYMAALSQDEEEAAMNGLSYTLGMLGDRPEVAWLTPRPFEHLSQETPFKWNSSRVRLDLLTPESLDAEWDEKDHRMMLERQLEAQTQEQKYYNDEQRNRDIREYLLRFRHGGSEEDSAFNLTLMKKMAQETTDLKLGAMPPSAKVLDTTNRVKQLFFEMLKVKKGLVLRGDQWMTPEDAAAEEAEEKAQADAAATAQKAEADANQSTSN